MHAIIAGAGIGGLTMALALARHGHSVTMVEQSAEMGEVGAGLQLGPNACKVLAGLGLEATLAEVAFTPLAAEVRGCARGDLLLRNPLGAAALRRWGAPYFQVHRADLHAILLSAVRQRSEVELRLGEKVCGAQTSDVRASLELECGDRIVGDILVGCDGVRSRVRQALFGPEAPRFTGQVAWRGVVEAARLPKDLIPPVAAVWTGQGKHFVHYYLRGGALVNLVGVVERDWLVESWNEPGDPAELQADFAGWPEPVRALCESVEQPFRWALYGRAPLRQWSLGRATLAGDACHPMLPFLAQGAAMAIEDAAVLATRLAAHADPVLALAAYERDRKPRTSRVQAWSARNARLFHLPEAGARAAFSAAKLVDRFTPGGAAARFDWLYGYDAA